MADQSRDLSWERLAWTRWASANPRAEVAQDQLAPRLLDPPSAEAAHSVLTLRASGTRYVRSGEQGSYIERGHLGVSNMIVQECCCNLPPPILMHFEGICSDFLKRTNRVVGFGERGMPP